MRWAPQTLNTGASTVITQRVQSTYIVECGGSILGLATMIWGSILHNSTQDFSRLSNPETLSPTIPRRQCQPWSLPALREKWAAAFADLLRAVGLTDLPKSLDDTLHHSRIPYVM